MLLDDAVDVPCAASYDCGSAWCGPCGCYPAAPDHGDGRYQEAFREQLAMPLRHDTLDELRWYFQARRAAPDHDDHLPADLGAFMTRV